MHWLVEYTRGGSRGYYRADADSEPAARAAASRELGERIKIWSVERIMTKAKNSERKNTAPEVSDEVSESIAAQADELGPEGGIIAVPDGASDDQVEQVLAGTGADETIAIEILSPVRCDGRVYAIGDEAGLPKAIAERLIECGSAKRI